MEVRTLVQLLMVAFSSVSCASASDRNLAAATDQNCTFDRSLGDGNIGPVQIGNAIDDLRKGYQISDSSLPYSDITGYAISLCGDAAIIVAEADERGVVISLSTISAAFETDRGGVVGMSLHQLQKIHPEGILSTGVEEGGWIAFRLDEIGGFFEFSLEGIAISCLRDKASCSPEFYERPAIRYWVR